jgi:hypothetical protein
MKTQIGVQLQVEGFHNWPDAPDEVAFLRHRHRHMFHIECRLTVSHADRDVEFFLLKRAIQRHMYHQYSKDHRSDNICEFGAMSCEMIAIEIMGAFDIDWCKVSEDGENYGIVTK